MFINSAENTSLYSYEIEMAFCDLLCINNTVFSLINGNQKQIFLRISDEQ